MTMACYGKVAWGKGQKISLYLTLIAAFSGQQQQQHKHIPSNSLYGDHSAPLTPLCLTDVHVEPRLYSGLRGCSRYAERADSLAEHYPLPAPRRHPDPLGPHGSSGKSHLFQVELGWKPRDHTVLCVRYILMAEKAKCASRGWVSGSFPACFEAPSAV